ncbi:MAG: LytTR family transcriptional regulator DNA-binding domain-containing protein [Clostridia bacterium]|nr:LytTR family transcriptional regulator DNA-binding domain-containing protein [Clostridia bacterium]
MKLEVRKVPESEPEMVEIRYHWITDEVQELISFVKSRQGQLTASRDGQRFEIPVMDLFYAESVDDQVFLYTAHDSFEIRMKLYELEELLRNRHFLRASKSMLVNLMKITSIRPALNGRFTAILKNGEEVIISRKYVPGLKQILKGGDSE